MSCDFIHKIAMKIITFGITCAAVYRGKMKIVNILQTVKVMNEKAPVKDNTLPTFIYVR